MQANGLDHGSIEDGNFDDEEHYKTLGINKEQREAVAKTKTTLSL